MFPGFIDPHVHIYLPFMGTYAKDTYATASRAALVGGTTTLIEMCCPARGDDPLAAFELWLSKGAESACDYTFHMGVSRFDETTAAAIREIAARGIASLKVFLAYKGAFGIDDGELFNTLTLAKELGLIVTAHCENETLVAELQRRLLAEGKTGPEWHEPSRPPRVEAEGVHHLMTFAELTGAHVYCVHTSCREALEAVQAARLRGVQAWVETVIPYLVLDKTYAEKPDFEGAKYVMSPPLRDKVAAAGAVERAALAADQHGGHRSRAVRLRTARRKWAAAISRRFPTASRRSRTASTCSTRTACAAGGSTWRRSSTPPARRRRGCSACIRARARSPSAATPTSWCTTRPTAARSRRRRSRWRSTTARSKAGRSKAGRALVTVRGQVQVRDGKFVGRNGHGQVPHPGGDAFLRQSRGSSMQICTAMPDSR